MGFDQPVEAVVAEALTQVLFVALIRIGTLVVPRFEVPHSVPFVGNVLNSEQFG